MQTIINHNEIWRKKHSIQYVKIISVDGDLVRYYSLGKDRRRINVKAFSIFYQHHEKSDENTWQYVLQMHKDYSKFLDGV